MLENPLKEVLVKNAGFLDMLGRTPVGSDTSLNPFAVKDHYDSPSFTETLQNQINPIEARSFRDGAELIKYLLKDPDSIRYLDDVQDLLGKDAKLQEVLKTERSLNDFARDRIYHRYGLQNYSADQLAKLDQNAKDRLEQETQRYVELVKNKLTPSLRSSLDKAHKNSQVPTQTAVIANETSPVVTPAAAPVSTTSVATAPANIGNSLTLGNTDPLANVRNPFGTAEKTTGKDIGYTYTQQEIPEFAGGSNPLSEPVETPAPAAEPKKTKTPAGLTRDETMQFLRQGYVPNSAGGFMLNEDAAANALRRMEADPNLNLGSSITDASRLSRIRNNMLNNPEYTAQARQQEADDMLYSQAMYHKQRQDAIAAKNNAAMEQYRGQLTNDARADYLRRGELDYQRSISTGAPLTPAAQWYQTYSNAEIDGNPLPDLPAEVQNGIEQGVHKFRGPLAAQQTPAAPATLKTNNPYVITQKNMDANARAYAANNSGREALNTVNNVWDPDRFNKTKSRYENAISGKNRLANPLTAQPAQPNVAAPAAPAAPSTSGTDVKSQRRGFSSSLNKSAGISNPLINPFLR